MFLLTVLVFACREENIKKTERLKEGEFLIKLYNSNGDLLLTRNGNAENLGTGGGNWEIRLLDPSFGQQNADPLKTFAFLTVFGQSELKTPESLAFNSDNFASFRQRWYSLQDDWGYESTDGVLNITSIEGTKITGNFEIHLQVGTDAQQNPLWGDHILVKGSFSSICPYESVGACN